MYISGIGIVSNRGRGIESLERALGEGWKKPEAGAYRVPREALNDKAVLKEARRADDLSIMALLAAHDACSDAGLEPQEPTSLGIIVATALGPHVTTFRFLDDIIDYGPAQVSPTVFSHSVHNAAASYISRILQARGPTLTVTRFAQSFHQAVALAQLWLNENRCAYVLAGCVDEYGKVMEYICSRKLRPAADGRIKPFLCAKEPEAVPGEGSVFFLLTNKDTAKRYATIHSRIVLADQIYTQCGNEPQPRFPDMVIFDADGMAGCEDAYLADGRAAGLVSGYAPLFGSMLTVSGFNCAAAALMLKERRCYPAPVQDNPHGLHLCAGDEGALESISCLRYGCGGERSELVLGR